MQWVTSSSTSLTDCWCLTLAGTVLRRTLLFSVVTFKRFWKRTIKFTQNCRCKWTLRMAVAQMGQIAVPNMRIAILGRFLRIRASSGNAIVTHKVLTLFPSPVIGGPQGALSITIICRQLGSADSKLTISVGILMGRSALVVWLSTGPVNCNFVQTGICTRSASKATIPVAEVQWMLQGATNEVHLGRHVSTVQKRIPGS